MSVDLIKQTHVDLEQTLRQRDKRIYWLLTFAVMVAAVA